MKTIIKATNFKLTSSNDANGKKIWRGYIEGVLPSGEKFMPTYVWNYEALALHRAIVQLIPEGYQIHDIPVFIELHGNEVPRKFMKDGMEVKTKNFKLEENGAKVLTGVLADIQIQKFEAYAVLQQTKDLLTSGYQEEALEICLGFMEKFTGMNDQEEIFDEDQTSGLVNEIIENEKSALSQLEDIVDVETAKEESSLEDIRPISLASRISSKYLAPEEDRVEEYADPDAEMVFQQSTPVTPENPQETLNETSQETSKKIRIPGMGFPRRR